MNFANTDILPTMKRLKFFTTQGCHLCEQAHLLIDESHDRFDFELEIVDISAKESLVQKYGLIIPVVLDIESNELLCWPFDRDDVINLLDG